MIYEIVITPHAFEELLASDHHTDHLASLKNLLLPDDELGNVVVADLDTDNWVRSIKAALARVPPTQKLRAQGFVKKLLGYVEPHPRQTNPMLEVEAGWINEAGSGINADFIDVVFVSRQAGKCERSLRISSISDPKLRSHKFRRSGVDVLTEEKQEEVFQRVLRLCDWCFIDLPYLAGSLANESITALQLIEIGAKSGALRNSPLHIDIRCQEDRVYWFSGTCVNGCFV